MIISDTFSYVYVGIPRTGSKSMNHWLCEHYGGRSHGGHHDWRVPPEAADYLIFTIVRNPYERSASGYFAVTWDDQAPTEKELEGCRNQKERLQRFRAVLKSRERQLQKDAPRQSPVSLSQRIRDAVALNETDNGAMNQKRFVDRARVKLALYFERLPQCLRELPFVDRDNLPPFPHHPERGIRPPGSFADFFQNTDEEQVQWAYAREDFEAFNYRRYDCGLSEDAPSALWIPGR